MNKNEFIDLLYSELNFYDDIEREDVTEETDLTLFSNWDSLIIAAALQANCYTLYSEDMQHEQIIDDTLTIVNPFLK